MALSPTSLLAYARTETGTKSVKYAAVSVVAIAVSLVSFATCYGGFRWSKTAAQTAAVVLSTIPSYWLNRTWVWGKSGKSHMWREVVPFWVISIGQFLISLIVVNVAGSYVEDHISSHLFRTLALLAVNLATYGVMWIGKFMFFNKVLFGHGRPKPIEPVKAGA